MPGHLALTQRLFTSDANVRNVKAFFSVKRAKFDPRIALLPQKSQYVTVTKRVNAFILITANLKMRQVTKNSYRSNQELLHVVFMDRHRASRWLSSH